MSTPVENLSELYYSLFDLIFYFSFKTGSSPSLTEFEPFWNPTLNFRVAAAFYNSIRRIQKKLKIPQSIIKKAIKTGHSAINSLSSFSPDVFDFVSSFSHFALKFGKRKVHSDCFQTLIKCLSFKSDFTIESSLVTHEICRYADAFSSSLLNEEQTGQIATLFMQSDDLELISAGCHISQLFPPAMRMSFYSRALSAIPVESGLLRLLSSVNFDGCDQMKGSIIEFFRQNNLEGSEYYYSAGFNTLGLYFLPFITQFSISQTDQLLFLKLVAENGVNEENASSAVEFFSRVILDESSHQMASYSEEYYFQFQRASLVLYSVLDEKMQSIVVFRLAESIQQTKNIGQEFPLVLQLISNRINDDNAIYLLSHAGDANLFQRLRNAQTVEERVYIVEIVSGFHGAFCQIIGIEKVVETLSKESSSAFETAYLEYLAAQVSSPIQFLSLFPMFVS